MQGRTLATTKKHSFTGTHLLLRYEECAADLDDLAFVDRALEDALVAAGATVLGKSTARFEPQGLSVVCLLAESHASIHTYPEVRSAFIDFFTCGTSTSPERFEAALKASLAPKRVHTETVQR
ncbi:MAG TPA: adenosylmethionine decarboxylase [Planctomycetota bacterium]|nr:adenosylmethionine decarboxylase [Planctomycetota bacterium]